MSSILITLLTRFLSIYQGVGRRGPMLYQTLSACNSNTYSNQISNLYLLQSLRYKCSYGQIDEKGYLWLHKHHRCCYTCTHCIEDYSLCLLHIHSLATKLLYPSRSKINVSSWNGFICSVHITFFKSTIICKQRKIQLQLPSSRAPPFPPSLKSLVSHKSHTERGKTS